MIKAGTRIELLEMPRDPDPVPVGSQGTVTFVAHIDFGYIPYEEEDPSFTQIHVDWDNGRRLMVVCPPDKFREID